MFQCSTCTTIFSHKHHLQRHLTRKKKCEVNTGDIKEKIKLIDDIKDNIIITDELNAYKGIGQVSYKHLSVNHS